MAATTRDTSSQPTLADELDTPYLGEDGIDIEVYDEVFQVSRDEKPLTDVEAITGDLTVYAPRSGVFPAEDERYAVRNGVAIRSLRSLPRLSSADRILVLLDAGITPRDFGKDEDQWEKFLETSDSADYAFV